MDMVYCRAIAMVPFAGVFLVVIHMVGMVVSEKCDLDFTENY